MNGIDPADWTPIDVRRKNAGLIVDWCRLGETRFTDPFFEQTVAHALRDPARLLFRRQTPIDELDDLARARPGLPPSGFIFHLSRCGSTLLAQLLAARPQNIVLSEAPPIDQVLNVQRYDRRISRDRRIAWLRGLVAALGQRRSGVERQLFVKFDSWHVLELPLIREAFPDVPWVFLYRDPVEVMVSQHRQPGTQMIPGILDPGVFGIDPATMAQMSLEEYCARVLAQICVAAARHAPHSRGRLVNFRQLPGVLWGSLGRHFGCEWTEGDREGMRRAAQTNAKNPGLPHQDDTAEKQREATDEIRRLAEVWLAEPYRHLEALRLAQTDEEAAAAPAASASSSDRSQSFTTQSMTR